MAVKVIKPTWERVATGSGLKIARDGTIFLEFANSRGEREYDWEGKAVFALSAVECGDVLEAVEAGGEKSFFHDPNKMGEGEGAITKTLRVSPARESGYFFSLTVNNKATGGAKYDTPVSAGELRVIRKIMDVSLETAFWGSFSLVERGKGLSAGVLDGRSSIAAGWEATASFRATHRLEIHQLPSLISCFLLILCSLRFLGCLALTRCSLGLRTSGTRTQAAVVGPRRRSRLSECEGFLTWGWELRAAPEVDSLHDSVYLTLNPTGVSNGR